LPTAFILISTETGAEEEVAKKLKELKSVKDVHLVWGLYDIVAKIKTHGQEDLEEYTSTIRQLNSIKRTITLLTAGGYQRRNQQPP